jgi:hypothetical protein
MIATTNKRQQHYAQHIQRRLADMTAIVGCINTDATQTHFWATTQTCTYMECPMFLIQRSPLRPACSGCCLFDCITSEDYNYKQNSLNFVMTRLAKWPIFFNSRSVRRRALLAKFPHSHPAPCVLG